MPESFIASKPITTSISARVLLSMTNLARLIFIASTYFRSFKWPLLHRMMSHLRQYGIVGSMLASNVTQLQSVYWHQHLCSRGGQLSSNLHLGQIWCYPRQRPSSRYCLSISTMMMISNQCWKLLPNVSQMMWLGQSQNYKNQCWLHLPSPLLFPTEIWHQPPWVLWHESILGPSGPHLETLLTWTLPCFHKIFNFWPLGMLPSSTCVTRLLCHWTNLWSVVLPAPYSIWMTHRACHSCAQ